MKQVVLLAVDEAEWKAMIQVSHRQGIRIQVATTPIDAVKLALRIVPDEIWVGTVPEEMAVRLREWVRGTAKLVSVTVRKL